MAKARKWRVEVLHENKPVDAIYVLAKKKARAVRIGILFVSDYHDLKINELGANAVISKDNLTVDTHQILAAAEWDVEE